MRGAEEGRNDVVDDEPGIVSICRSVRAGEIPPREFDTAFRNATVYAPRPPDRVGIMTSTLPDGRRWGLVFSTLDRLSRAYDDVHWLSTMGADLLEQLPPGIGILLDPHDDHGLPLLPQPSGPARFAGAILPPGAPNRQGLPNTD